MKSWLIDLLISSIVLISLTGGAKAAGVDCLSCHAEKATAKSSVHGGLSCTACHTTKTAYPHNDKATPVNCASCHAGNASAVSQSVHAVSGGPSCLSCHGGAHEILSAKDPKSTTYPSNLPRTCGVCHGNSEVGKQAGAKQVYARYMDSIHGFSLTQDGLLVAANCVSCHGSHSILNNKDPKSKTNRANVPATCGACHAGPLQAYNSGIHGQMMAAGAENAPVCTDCHTTHQIAKVGSADWGMKTTATCGGCHKDEFSTYRDTFHAQVSSLGYQQVARCWDCHGFHDILPASDPKSAVAPAQLIATCGKCHPDADASFVKYDPHADSHNKAHYPFLHYTAIFMNLLLSGVLGFFALHTILWFLRSRSERGSMESR